MIEQTMYIENPDIVEANIANQQTIQIGRGRKTIEIGDLAREVKRQQESALDFVVKTSSMKAVRVPNGAQEQADIADDMVPEPRTVNIQLNHENGRGIVNYEMTDWAHRQLAEKCGIPIKYYFKMLEAGKHDLVVENVNEWIQGRDRRRVRTMDGKIRAIVSDRFLPLDNHIVANEFLEGIMAHGLDPNKDVQACSITDTHMHIRATVPHMKADIRQGDTLVQGLMVSNSEVGASSFKVEPFLLRLVCSNGLIAPQALSRIHLGSAVDVGEFQFSAETMDKELDLIKAQVREVIQKTFDEKLFYQWIDDLQGAANTNIPNVVEAVNHMTALYNLKSQKDSILNQLAQEGDPSQYGMVNALTRLAQDSKTFEQQIDLERIAGKISIMDEKEFSKKIAVEV